MHTEHRLHTEEQTTLENILEAGKKEFLAKGFQAASLRSIVKEAGVTTGAFYGYYASKEALFDAIVAEQANRLMEEYIKAQTSFAKLPPKNQKEEMGEISGDCMDWMFEYVYQHPLEFKLLICYAQGTRYENFIHKMVEIEVKATHDFMSVLRGMGHEVKEMDSQLEHILVSGMFSGFFEMVIHDMPKEQAAEYIKELREFYTAGWKAVMGL